LRYYYHIEFIVQTSREAFGVDSHIVQWPKEEEVDRHVGELLFHDHPLPKGYTCQCNALSKNLVGETNDSIGVLGYDLEILVENHYAKHKLTFGIGATT
jgi:hypothetical protein